MESLIQGYFATQYPSSCLNLLSIRLISLSSFHIFEIRNRVVADAKKGSEIPGINTVFMFCFYSDKVNNKNFAETCTAIKKKVD